jgi:hypothetical protein
MNRAEQFFVHFPVPFAGHEDAPQTFELNLEERSKTQDVDDEEDPNQYGKKGRCDRQIVHIGWGSNVAR